MYKIMKLGEGTYLEIPTDVLHFGMMYLWKASVCIDKIEYSEQIYQ